MPLFAIVVFQLLADILALRQRAPKESIHPILVPPTFLPLHATEEVLFIPHSSTPSNALFPLVHACAATGLPVIPYLLYPRWTGLQKRRLREYLEAIRIFQPRLTRLHIVAHGYGGTLARWAMQKSILSKTQEGARIDISDIRLLVINARSAPDDPDVLRIVQEFLQAA